MDQTWVKGSFLHRGRSREDIGKCTCEDWHICHLMIGEMPSERTSLTVQPYGTRTIAS
jgi:hypothetical protein